MLYNNRITLTPVMLEAHLLPDPETFWAEIAEEKLCFCEKFLPI